MAGLRVCHDQEWFSVTVTIALRTRRFQQEGAITFLISMLGSELMPVAETFSRPNRQAIVSRKG